MAGHALLCACYSSLDCHNHSVVFQASAALGLQHIVEVSWCGCRVAFGAAADIYCLLNRRKRLGAVQSAV
jgi:hypothetical protein